ncbi:MAG: two-component system sensor histidine kinase FlrB [Moritella sp.]|jgi:two-component system sensor histidine kinase FlrB
MVQESYPGELAELRAHKDRNEKLVEALPSGLVILDGNGIVIEVNKVATQLLDESLIGSRWLDVIQRAFTPKEDDGHEVSLKNGRKVQLSITTLGSQPGQLIMLTDLTYTRHLQERVSHMKQLSSLGRMVASLAHQIRTPLSAALLYGSNLANPNLPLASRKRFQSKLIQRLNDLENQVNDMLLFARTGKDLVVEEISLQNLLLQVQAGSEAMMLQTSSQMQVTLPEPDLLILANRNALSSAIGNLIQNALHACGQGASLTISAVRSGDDKVAIIVGDDGPGIPKLMQQKILEPFFTTKSQGTGLGLAVVQSVVKAHQGNLSLDSTEGKGSNFSIILPLHRVAQPQPMVIGG